MSGQFYAPAANPLVPTEEVARWAPESVWTRWRREKSLHLTETESSNSDRPARSHSLHRLSYPGSEKKL